MIENIEDKYLSSIKIIQLWASAIEQVKEKNITNITRIKQEWLDQRIADYGMEITTFYRRSPDWKEK